jgi:putative tricarboxylic transport membrane protein
MELLQHLTYGFNTLVGWQPILVVITGVILGIFVGAMPGLSPSTGVALLVPFSYTMSPALALILLASIYLAANYGGSITAVLINTPGTPSAAVTAIDGYPLTVKGQPGKGLGTSLVASTIGGAIGAVILIFFSVPLAKVAVKFHPADYFALAIFGLSTVASMAGKNVIKTFAAIVFGLLIKTIGLDPISGVERFTFGVDRLYDGFTLIPALIGLFALSVVFTHFEEYKFGQRTVKMVSSKLPSLQEFWRIKLAILQSSIIGTIIGIFPGAGATIATFISYDIAKRTSSTPEEFGNGSLEGVSAAEAANSSSVGGALVPLLTLGIPGSATSAVLLGAFMIHDLNPGPQLFVDHPDIVYGIFASLIVANIIMLTLGLLGTRFFVKVVAVPDSILYPMIFIVAVMGSYSISYSLFDVGACIGFGIIGWIFKRYGYPVAPVVLGIVLGKMIEENFRRAVMMDGWTIFFTRKLSLIVLTLGLLSFAWPLYQNYTRRKQATSED